MSNSDEDRKVIATANEVMMSSEGVPLVTLYLEPDGSFSTAFSLEPALSIPPDAWDVEDGAAFDQFMEDATEGTTIANAHRPPIH